MSQTSENLPSREPATFTGEEAKAIDLSTAAHWTAIYRELNPKQTRAHFFGRKIIEQILAQPDCIGLRIYYAVDPATSERHLLVVGADANQNDQLPDSVEQPSDSVEARGISGLGGGVNQYIIAEMSVPCPDQCGKANRLNSFG